jgi:hypothetical protein
VKKRVLIFILIACFSKATALYSQSVVRSDKVIAVSYAGSKVNRIYIPPPKEFLLKSGSKGKGATIKVYYSGFTSAPRAAFEYAVSILSSLLPSNAVFTIRANWGPLADASVLGSTSVSSYYGGAYIDALEPGVYYPSALAEKIFGKSLNSDEEGDLTMTINSKISWYTGTDGKTPVTNYDLVTVVLHEMIHGIGFVDSFNSSNSIGSYGINSIPVIYDTFIEDKDNNLLTDKSKYSNNSAELNTALTSAQIYFDGPLLKNYTSGQRVRLYAPSEWDAGSSISHLNESSTSPGNALLTPFLDKGEAIHSPGDLIMSMLGDLGWINTKISHTPLKDTETPLMQVTFKASITSDTTFQKNYAGVVYSFNKSSSWDTIYMVPPQTGDTFMVNLSIPGYNTFLSYYFFVNDKFNRNYKLPSAGSAAPYIFFIGTDTTKPLVQHSPVKNIFDKTPEVKLSANASDNIGIDTVYIEYRKNSGTIMYKGMVNDSLDYYSGIINLKTLSLVKGDTLKYRIMAVDNSSKANKIISPSTGYHTVDVENTFAVVAAYSTDFTSASADFILDGFSLSKPSQFNSNGLNSAHPYPSPEKDNESLEFTAVLRYPVKVDETGIVLSYQEIVLVEPGETGSVYGSSDFYDYVIVEATKDFGANWFPLENGYDSRISTLFLNAYNSAMNAGNSTYVPVQGDFQKHTIEIRTFDKFSKNDTLIIRFRLYSDPYAHGWGWSVDDLSIKSVAAGIPDIGDKEFRLYPNPGSGMIRIAGDESSTSVISFDVINISGFTVKKGTLHPAGESVIDITGQPPGIYIIIFKSGNRNRSVKYLKLR